MLSFLCRHDFYWSERHRSDRCRRCGHLRAGEGAGPTQAGSLAALLAADDGGLETLFIPAAPSRADTILEDWEGADAAPSAPPVQAVLAVQPVPARKAAPRKAAPKSAALTGNGGPSLLDRIEHLAAGGDLSRAETIETLLAVIEDGQSSDPVLFGPAAANWYARLHSAR